jgi:hypothetical protein
MEEDLEETSSLSIEEAFRKVMKAQRLARTRRGVREAAQVLNEALSGLNDEDFRQVMASDELQELAGRAAAASGGNPGDPVRDDRGREIYRVPYSYDWITSNMPMVTWTVPQEPFGRRIWEAPSWNGVICPVPLRNNEEVTTPICFRDIVMEAHRQIVRALSSQEQVLAGVRPRAADVVSVGAGFVKPTEEELLASGEWRRT